MPLDESDWKKLEALEEAGRNVPEIIRRYIDLEYYAMKDGDRYSYTFDMDPEFWAYLQELNASNHGVDHLLRCALYENWLLYVKWPKRGEILGS